jgi:hydroxymethylbilane synthase
MDRIWRIGTRGSRLALRQAELALAALRRAFPGLQHQLVVVRTTGDRARHIPLAHLGGRGAFVAELEAALLREEVDLAVHSLKDLPAHLPDGLTLAAVPLRDDPRDALVSRHGHSWRDLPPGSVVGTSSLRRAVQLRLLRPDLKVVPIRGNVDTRVRKAQAGEVDAVVVAAAALDRLHILPSYLFPPEEMLPAAGQGAIAIEVRATDSEALALAQAVDDQEARACVTAERAFEAQLGVGCHGAAAALATLEGGRLRLRGLLSHPSEETVVRDEMWGLLEEAEELGRRLAAALLTRAEALGRKGHE